MVTFTTLEACPVPYNLSAEPAGYTAKLRWTGYSDSYNIRYRTAMSNTWMTATANAYASVEISNLEGSTTYEFQVQGVCDGETTDWSETFTFTTKVVRQTVRTGNWDVASTWDPAGVPAIDEDVIVQHNVTVPAGVVAQANNIIEGGSNATRITLEEGAQLVHNRNGNLLQETEVIVKKDITGHGSGNGNWYLIANPSTSSLEPDYSIYGFMSGSYDLYRFDYTGSDKKEWRNNKTTSFSLDVNQSGYLYANEAGTTLNI